MTDTAYQLVLDGFFDWEASLAAAEINKSQRYRIVTVGLTAVTVRSMGGLDVTPQITVPDMKLERAAILLVPGGTAWGAGEEPEVTSLLQRASSETPRIRPPSTGRESDRPGHEGSREGSSWQLSVRD